MIEPSELRGATGTVLAEAVLARAVAEDVLPPDTASGQPARLLANFDATVRAVRDHGAHPYHGPILAFRAEQEPMAASPVSP